MQNPYLDKVRRAVDERTCMPTDELQALALVAIALELQGIRLHLDGDTPSPAEPMPALVFYETSDATAADGIVVG
jgi:hypothetical protein